MVGWKDIYRHYLNLTAPDGASINFSWQRCRKAFLAKVGKQCVCCSSKKQIEVHHIQPRHIRPDLAVDQTNLIALCHDCHFHLAHGNNYRKYNNNIMDVAMYAKKHSILKLNRKDD